MEGVSKTELGKKAGQIGEEISKTAKGAAESISETGQALGKTGAFQKISKTAEAVQKELDQHGIQGLHNCCFSFFSLFRRYIYFQKLQNRSCLCTPKDIKKAERDLGHPTKFRGEHRSYGCGTS